MKIIDYLRAKYCVSGPTTMLYIEAKAFGISYPLKSGWLREYGDTEVTPAMAAELRKQLPRKTQASAQKGLDVLDKAWLEIKRTPEPYDPAFLESKAWKRLRYQALRKHGARCQACGATPETGARLNVDHIKPRLLFPGLALSLNNLQVLCSDCNEGKGNWDMTDFRAPLETSK